MNAEDLKTKTEDELKKLLLDTRKEQMNLRFQRSGGQLENTAQIRKVRRSIARIKTFLSATKAAPAGKAEAAKPVKAKKPAAKKSGTKAA
jgi:large subunit ribosomal protein L29